MSQENKPTSKYRFAPPDHPIYRTGTMIFFGGMRKIKPEPTASLNAAEENEDESTSGERT